MGSAPIAHRFLSSSHLSLDVDEPIEGWTQFFAAKGIEVAEDHLGRPSVGRHILARLLDEQRECETRLAERAEQATREAPVAVGIPAVAGATPLESIMANDPGYQTVEQELGRGGRSVFTQLLDEQLAAGRRHQQAEARGRATEGGGGVRTVSVRKTAKLASRCDRCGLWFEFLHPGTGGRYLCRMSLELSGNNRAANGGYSVHPGSPVVAVNGRSVT
jgi:hypothetical protein